MYSLLSQGILTYGLLSKGILMYGLLSTGILPMNGLPSSSLVFRWKAYLLSKDILM